MKIIFIGICQEKTDGGHEHWSAGVGNGRLQYRPHALLLEYKDGSPCKNNLTRSTTIEFVCAEETLEEIVFIEEAHSCSYLISWHTALACSRTLYVSIIFKKYLLIMYFQIFILFEYGFTSYIMKIGINHGQRTVRSLER